ncbi:DNA-(apurinic or apyrimidinic site) endonuclease, chloroplastic-like protein [Drosera capensis]
MRILRPWNRIFGGLESESPASVELWGDLRFGAWVLRSQMRAMAVEAKKDRENVTSVVVDSGSGSRKRLVELWDFQVDAVKLERMTVQELRTALRSCGVSSKGRKHELIAALKLVMESKVEGDRSLIVESSNTETTSINESLQNEDDFSGVLPLQRCSRTAKKLVDKYKTSNCTVVTASSQEISIQTANVSGLKHPRTLELDSESTTEHVAETTFEIEPWTRFAHQKPQKGWVAYNPRTMRLPPLAFGTKFVKLISWNVNGLRAVRKFNGFSGKAFAQREDFDELEKSKPVILTGDLNRGHQEIDIYNPAVSLMKKGNHLKTITSPMDLLIFRRQHPNVVGYTYWGYRHGGRKTNKGCTCCIRLLLYICALAMLVPTSPAVGQAVSLNIIVTPPAPAFSSAQFTESSIANSSRRVAVEEQWQAIVHQELDDGLSVALDRGVEFTCRWRAGQEPPKHEQRDRHDKSPFKAS